jgi:aspartate/tyrosine/aromatic aminotransferase
MQRILSVKQAFSASSKAYDLFSHVDMAPQDPIIGTKLAYNKDQSEEKVNLGQGVYKDNEGNGFVF